MNSRIKPSTSDRLTAVVNELHEIADDIAPARPFLAKLLPKLADAIDSAKYPRDSDFVLELPESTRAIADDRFVRISPKDD